MGKWLTKLNELDGYVNADQDIFASDNVVAMPSPSLGYVFGKGNGLPRGLIVTLFGPPGGGKSVTVNHIIGQLHHDDPEAIVVKFNTELREAAQLPATDYPLFGIDKDRYVAYNTNAPELIFDRIETEIAAMCEAGAPIKLIVVDSLNNIQGRRSQNATTILTQQIGDEAATLKDGFKRIQSVLRKYGIAMICTNQIRAELDAVEQMRGNKIKMASAFSTQHYIEYFLYVEKNRTKDAKADLLGQELVDSSKVDMAGKEEKTGFKVRFQMKKSTVGIDGRSGEFTWDFKKGIINTHEEIFELGTGLGVITKPNNVMYEFGGNQWRGKEAMITAIRDNTELYNNIWEAIKKLDK
jgi:RecA/RadA recombinase